MPKLSPAWGPRPRGRITPGQLPDYEAKKQFLWQRKFNGTSVLVYVEKGKPIIVKNGGDRCAQFETAKLHKDVLSLDLEKGVDYCFHGELMNNKTTTKQYKGKVILYDLLKAGRYLNHIGAPTQIQRLEQLAAICGNPTQFEPHLGIALQATPNIWLAEYWDTHATARYEDFIQHPEIEGLILRRKDSRIKPGEVGGKKYEVEWVKRCRKPHSGGSYDF